MDRRSRRYILSRTSASSVFPFPLDRGSLPPPTSQTTAPSCCDGRPAWQRTPLPCDRAGAADRRRRRRRGYPTAGVIDAPARPLYCGPRRASLAIVEEAHLPRSDGSRAWCTRPGHRPVPVDRARLVSALTSTMFVHRPQPMTRSRSRPAGTTSALRDRRRARRWPGGGSPRFAMPTSMRSFLSRVVARANMWFDHWHHARGKSIRSIASSRPDGTAWWYT